MSEFWLNLLVLPPTFVAPSYIFFRIGQKIIGER